MTWVQSLTSLRFLLTDIPNCLMNIIKFHIHFRKNIISLKKLIRFLRLKITSGGISADFGIPGESIACFPSVTTSLTSSTFFFLPRVPNLFQIVSSLPGVAGAFPATAFGSPYNVMKKY